MLGIINFLMQNNDDMITFDDVINYLMENRDMIGTLIAWLPTILFLIFLFFAIIVGLIRGFRKSLILFIHMLIAGGVCLGVFLFIVNTPDMDKSIVSFLNDKILINFDMSVQQIFGVGPEYESVHQMLMRLITANMDEGELAYHLITDNGAYIATIIEMVYRILLGIILSVVYFVLLTILKLIYAIFYPVRRTIKKHNAKFKRGELPYPYKKRRLLGGLVGGFRGIVLSVIMLSFVGATLFIITGGSTNPSREELGDPENELSFGSDAVNVYYDYFSYICDMGDTGVFKVLNNIKDPDNTPYYFYICDLILQGGVHDEYLGVDGTFYLRDEIGNYIRFTKDVMTLVLRYATQEELDIILNNVTGVQNGVEISTNISGSNEDGTDILNTVLGIMAKPGFSDDFGTLIDEFEAKTYFVNIVLSTLNSVINNIECLNVGPEVEGLIKCLFVDGDNSIKITDLATEKDVKHLFKTVVKLLANADVETSDDPTETTINYVKSILPVVQELSIFDERKDVGNKFLGSLYTYCAETFIKDVSLPQIPDDVDWIKELNTLLDVVDPVLTLYGNVYNGENSNLLVQNLFNMFDKDNEDALENEQSYDILVDCLSDSLLLDIIFKSSFVTDALENVIGGITGNTEQKLPLGAVDFGNKKDEHGGIIYGECYYLLTALKQLIKSDNDVILNMMNNGDMGTDTIKDLVNLLVGDLYPDDPNKNQALIDTLLESKVLQYSLSAIISGLDLGGVKLTIPTQATDILEENEVEYKIIKKSELKALADSLAASLDTILELAESEEVDVTAVIYDDELISSLENSQILESTVAVILVNTLTEVEAITIPLGYDNTDLWINTRDDAGEITDKGELRLLIDAIKSTEEIEGFDINDLLEGNFDITILENIPTTVLETMLKSQVIHYTFSNVLTSMEGDFKVVVPKKSLVLGVHQDIKENNVKLIKVEDLISAIESIFKVVSFDAENDNSATIKYGTLFNKKAEILASGIIQATIIDLLYSMTEDADSVINMPATYKADALDLEILDNNIWFGATDEVNDDELFIFLSAVEELLGGNITDDFDLANDINNIKITNESTSQLSTSAVLNATITHNIINAGLSIPESIDTDIIYENEMLKKVELDKLFTNLITLFGTGEGEERYLAIDSLSSIDITSIEFTRAQIDDALSSNILAYSISSEIINQNTLSVPLDVTRNDIPLVGTTTTEYIVTFEELVSLFNCVFELFGDSINLTSIDTSNLEITRDIIDTILSSGIIASTISNEILNIDTIYAPLGEDSVTSINVYDSNSANKYKANAVIDYKKTALNQNPEMYRLFDGLFAILGDSIKVNEINITDLSLKRSQIDQILSSNILKATISNEIVGIESLYVPHTAYDSTLEFYNDKNTAVIHSTELDYLFDIIFNKFGNQVDEDVVLDINNIDASSLTLKLSEMNPLNENYLFNSQIMSTTISNEVSGVDSLYIPLTPDVCYSSSVYGGRNVNIIAGNELSSLFVILFEMFGTPVAGDVELSITGIDASNLTIKESKVDTLLASKIMEATISNNIASNDFLSIPTSTYELISILGKSNKPLINKGELRSLFNLLFDLFGSSDEDSELDITGIDSKISINESNKEALKESSIMLATISTNITSNTTGIVIVDSILTDDTIYNKNDKLIAEEELSALIDALLVIKGGSISTDSTELTDMSVPTSTDERTALTSSVILRATISEQVFANETTILIEASEEDNAFNIETYNNTNVLVLTSYEIMALMEGADEIGASSEFNNLSLDIISLMADPDRSSKIEAINNSAIYRYLISQALVQDSMSYKIYNFVYYDSLIPGADMETNILNPTYYSIKPIDGDVEVYDYNKNSSYVEMFSTGTIEALNVCHYGIPSIM